MSVFASMPLQWKEVFKWQSAILHVNSNNLDYSVSPPSSRRLHWELVDKIAIAPISKGKFPTNNLPWYLDASQSCLPRLKN